ncbi:hypothetical protein SUNI508_04268 [Seiridium unicorne]|uniref:Uncharacterized protein n=1 Tax=Seiridium unicorne TaxID=138068 RepID=A0ABR2VA00_9PEZI
MSISREKTAIVTGSNTGIGLECARQLLDLGLSKLILAVRNEDKGHHARENLLSTQAPSLPDGTIEVGKLDICVYDTMTAFAKRAESLERLDIVILDAAVCKQTHEVVPATGHEEMLQVNVLSTALLAILLLQALKAKNTPEEPGRIAWVQSDTASWAKFKNKDCHTPPTSFG